MAEGNFPNVGDNALGYEALDMLETTIGVVYADTAAAAAAAAAGEVRGSAVAKAGV